jgi:hypothetical protein
MLGNKLLLSLLKIANNVPERSLSKKNVGSVRCYWGAAQLSVPGLGAVNVETV